MIVLQGHGTRARQLRGPEAADGKPTVGEVITRRYRCQICRVVVTVVPAEVLPSRLYSASAIAMAMALFGVARRGARAVRALISPWRIVGAATTGWATLRRWVHAVREQRLWRCVRPGPSTWTDHSVAARAATTVAACAPPSAASLSIATAVFTGAAHAR